MEANRRRGIQGPYRPAYEPIEQSSQFDCVMVPVGSSHQPGRVELANLLRPLPCPEEWGLAQVLHMQAGEVQIYKPFK
jgi:hypothetical protein